MKHITLFLLFGFTIGNVYAQTVTPLRSTEQCPGVNITITVTIAAKSIQDVQPKALNANPIVVQQPFNLSSSGGSITFSFIGQFTDNNNNQTFAVFYTNSSNENKVFDITYIKIKSLLTANSFSEILPTPINITSPRCQINTHTISFANVKYGNPWENPHVGYGSITTYEYLLPVGWSLGGITSNGGNWIAGGNSVTVTSDANHGDGGAVQIRAINPCGVGLVKGQITNVSISRPRPPLNIVSGNGNDYICAGTVNYSLDGTLPPGATVTWTLNNNTYVTIPDPSIGPTVPVSFVSQGSATLTATVTDCVETYPEINKTIVAGPYISGWIIASANSYNHPGTQYNLTGGISLLLVPNDIALFQSAITSTSLSNINWSWSGYPPSNVITGGLGLTFSLPAASTPWTQRTTIWTLTAQHPCGVVNLNIPYTVVSKGGFGFRIIASPNPAINNLRLTFTEESKEVKALDSKTGVVIKLYSLNSAIRAKQWNFLNDRSHYDLNVSGLKTGQYVIEITRGKFKESKQIQIR